MAGIVAQSALAQDGQPRGRTALEEVVVTAQRRMENLQEVPISVVAIQSDTLANAGVDATISLPEIVPSVQLVRSGPVAMFFIRGVGNTSAGTGEEGANAIYVDGVYISDMKQSVLKFNNIERIEVLKGPQGTLFGRNSSGGLVNIITRDPGDELEIKATVGVANYDTTTSQLYVAGPIAENLSADIALYSSNQSEGWGENVITGKDVHKGWDWGARSKWVWNPSDTATISFSAEYGKTSDDFTTEYTLVQGSVGVGGFVPPSDPFDTASDRDGVTKSTNKGATLIAEFDLGWSTLTSVTGWRDNDTETHLDSDGSSNPFVQIDIRSGSEMLQQEIRLASENTDRLSWQTGLFYMLSDAELSPQRQIALGSGASAFSKLESDSIAAFGEVTYEVTDSTQLTVGLRYTKDERELSGRLVPTAGSPVMLDGSVTDEELTYRLALRQQITDSFNVYASYNRGFKSGTFSMSVPTNPPIEPQTTDAYEVGFKSELLDRRLRLNGALFRYEISDYQTRAATGAGASAQLLNAGEAEVDGFELELEAVPFENFTVYASATWLDSEFTKFDGAPFTYPNPGSCAAPGVITGPRSGGAYTCYGDASGNTTPLAPDFAATIGGSYTVLLANGGELRFSTSYAYNDGAPFEPDNRLKRDSYGLWNASVGYRINRNWAVDLWGRNLTDEEYHVQMVGSALGDLAQMAAPRTYGVNFHYTY